MENRLILIITLFFSGFSFGQISFFKTYGENGFDYGQGLVQLDDSSYVITGASSSFQDAPSRAFLLKVDSMGTYLWSRSYGGDRSDWGRRVFHKENVGFWIAGYSNSFSNYSDFDFYLIKTDESGEPEWERTYGSDDWERLWDAVLLQDEGLFMVGETDGLMSQEEDLYMVRTQANGDTLWTKYIRTAGKDIGYSAINFSDTTVLIGGISSSITDTKTGYLALIHINSGEILWEKFHGAGGTAAFRSLYEFNSNVYGVGEMTLDGENQRDHWMTKLDSNGDILYENTDSRPEDDFLSNVAVRDMNSMFITAWIDEDIYPNGPDLLFAKYHTDMYWNGTSSFFSGENPDECHQMIISKDGGAVLVGFGMDPSWTNGGSAITLIKVGPGEEIPSGITSDQTLVYLSENENSATITVFPNPVRSALQIQVPENWESANYQLIDPSGRSVKSGTISSSLDVSDLESGMYFLRIIQEDKFVGVRIVKE